MLGNGISLIWSHFYSCLLSNRLFAKQFSNFFNSLNFEAKINCNTSKPNVPKWRKTCTGLQFDVVHFNGPQSHLLSGGKLWGPCTWSCPCWSAGTRCQSLCSCCSRPSHAPRPRCATHRVSGSCACSRRSRGVRGAAPARAPCPGTRPAR